MEKLEYMKKFRAALTTYQEENQTIDLPKIRQIYEYANNLDNLDSTQKKELDTFIDENTTNITHLANIYLDENGISNLTKKLKRIRPIQITKPQSKIRFVKSDINILYDAINPVNRVKVLCKIKNQSKAA